jgi:Immunoglobulin domain
MSRSSSVRALVVLCLLAVPSFGQLCAPDWAPSNFASALDGAVLCAAVYDPGTGPQLYVGGDFTAAGGAASPGIAMWDGIAWQSVGGGVVGSVNSLVVHDDGTGPQLYVGGWFSGPGNNIARWNGLAWSAPGNGFNSGVQGMASYNDGTGLKLYAGGWFTTSGIGAPAYNRFAAWDGLNWNQVGTGLNSGMNACGVFQGNLYVFGSFNNAGGVPTPGMARYSGAGWANIGAVGAGSVNAVTLHDDGSGLAMYICGLFITVAGVPANRIAKFDGISWSALGSGLDSLAYGLTSFDDGGGAALYAAGNFANAGGVPATRVAKWFGGAWSALGAGVSGGAARALAGYTTQYGPSLYVGGAFSTVGSLAAAVPNLAIYGPVPPFIVTSPASQVVNAGANVVFTVVAGGQGNIYQWQHNGGPILGATNPTLNLTAVTPLDWGVYDCIVANGCGNATTAPASLTLNPGFSLSMTQPFGPLSLLLTHSSPTQPGGSYLTTFSFDTQNVTMPGQGPWAGMFVPFSEIVNQFLFLFPPFVGTLDGSGSAAFILSSGQLPLALFGVPVCAVSMTFIPSPISLINNSNLQLITIQ